MRKYYIYNAIFSQLSSEKVEIVERVEALEEDIIDIQAENLQQVPLFANNIEECTDTSKLYVLPDGYIYAYIYTEKPAYTNILSTAIDTDGTPYNGGLGYKAGIKLSTSNVETDNDYATCTGYYRVNGGDVIRIKNTSETPQSSEYHLFLNSKFQNAGSGYWGNHEEPSLGYNTKRDENGVITLTIPSYNGTTMYYRYTTGTIDETSIITLNEEITDETIREYSWCNTGHAFVPADYEERIVELEKFAEQIDETIEDVINNSATSFDYTAYGLPILYLNGDTSLMTKDNKVTLDYAYGDKSGTCSVKWQGSSSLTYPKKNYTVTFDNAFEAIEGWGEQKKYCMKANFMDFSHSRNICCAKLWGQIVKSRASNNSLYSTLSALPNWGAVDGFPIIIVINDEYQGIYTFNIPKDGWMFGMGSGTQEAIICADKSGAGNFATLFENEAICDGSDFEIEYATDENDTAWIVTSINRLINAVLASDGSDIDTTIAQYVDISSAIDYLLFTPLVHGADMLRKNYLLVTYDGVKWFFSAYDMDSTFGITWHAGYYGDTDGGAFNPAIGSANNQYPTLSSMTTHKLFRLLIENKQEAIKARYNELRAGAMSEANVAHEFNEFAASIPKPYFDEEPKVWATIPATSANNANQIITHYMLRTPKIDGEVNKL